MSVTNGLGLILVAIGVSALSAEPVLGQISTAPTVTIGRPNVGPAESSNPPDCSRPADCIGKNGQGPGTGGGLRPDMKPKDFMLQWQERPQL